VQFSMNLYRKLLLPKYLDASMKKEALEKLRPQVVSKAYGIVLEVGFGSGLNLPYYGSVIKLYALDPSEGLYSLAQERISHALFPVEYLQASAEEIPLPDSSVDSVISTWSLCSIPDIHRALSEVHRVLKPQGKFIFIEHGKSPKKFLSFLQRIVTPISKLIAGGCHMNREIDRLVTTAGFTLEEIERFTQKGKPLIVMYRGVAVKGT
jgi:ubiquinone/menaquinone biosynthesis C-methylase UbiE